MQWDLQKPRVRESSLETGEGRLELSPGPHRGALPPPQSHPHSLLWSRDKDPRVLRGGKNLKPWKRVKCPRENVGDTRKEEERLDLGCRDALFKL